MSFAYMPFFTGDYLRDTRHLSMAEHGSYMLALMYCWDAKGPMPLDERKQFAIVCARSGDEMEAWRRMRDEFFVRMEDGWYQPRMQQEIERSEALSRTRSEAGRKGYEARARHLPSKSQASAKQLHLSPSPSPSPSSTPKSRGAHSPDADALPTHPKTDARPKGARLPADWQPSEAELEWARRERPDLHLPTTIASFRDYWVSQPGQRGVKLDWVATFRNWVRRETARPRPVNAAVAAGIPEWALGENPEPPPGTPRTKYQSDLGI